MTLDWLAGNHIVFFLAAWLVSYALHSTLLIGGAWLITRPARISMGTRDALWKVALAGAFLTATWQTIGIGATPFGGRLELPLSVVEADPVGETLPPLDAQEVQIGSSRAQVVRTPSEAEGAEEAGDEKNAGSFPAWLREQAMGTTGARILQLLLGLWALGAAVGLSRVLVARVRLYRVLRGRRTLEGGPARLALDRLCDEAEWDRPVRLTISTNIAGPIALGRDEICLPERALASFRPRQLESVLAHELAHLTRRDPSWRLAGWLIERVFFFQPLLRLARRELQECAEFLCDDWAVARTGDGVSLARCLVEVAEWRQGTVPATSAPEMAAGDSPLGRRVERLLESRGGRELPRLLSAMAAVLLLALVGSGAPVITVKAPASARGSSAEASSPVATLAELVGVPERAPRPVREIQRVRGTSPSPRVRVSPAPDASGLMVAPRAHWAPRARPTPRLRHLQLDHPAPPSRPASPGPPSPPAPPAPPEPPSPPAPPSPDEFSLPGQLGTVLVFEVSQEEESAVQWKATLDLQSLARALPAVRNQVPGLMEQLAAEQRKVQMEGVLQLKEKELQRFRMILDMTREELAKRREKI